MKPQSKYDVITAILSGTVVFNKWAQAIAEAHIDTNVIKVCQVLFSDMLTDIKTKADNTGRPRAKSLLILSLGAEYPIDILQKDAVASETLYHLPEVWRSEEIELISQKVPYLKTFLTSKPNEDPLLVYQYVFFDAADQPQYVYVPSKDLVHEYGQIMLAAQSEPVAN